MSAFDVMYEDVSNLAQNGTTILGLVLTLYFARSVGGLSKHPAARRLGRANGIVTAGMMTLVIGMVTKIAAVTKSELRSSIAPEPWASIGAWLAWSAFGITLVLLLALLISGCTYRSLKNRKNESASNKVCLLSEQSADIYLPADGAEDEDENKGHSCSPRVPHSELTGKPYAREVLKAIDECVKDMK